MPLVDLKDVVKRYGTNTVLNGVSLSVDVDTMSGKRTPGGVVVTVVGGLGATRMDEWRAGRRVREMRRRLAVRGARRLT